MKKSTGIFLAFHYLSAITMTIIIIIIITIIIIIIWSPVYRVILHILGPLNTTSDLLNHVVRREATEDPVRLHTRPQVNLRTGAGSVCVCVCVGIHTQH